MNESLDQVNSCLIIPSLRVAAKTEEGGVLCLIAKILLPSMRERDFCFCQELDISSHTFQEIEDNFVDITVVDKLLDA